MGYVAQNQTRWELKQSVQNGENKISLIIRHIHSLHDAINMIRKIGDFKLQNAG
jgi:hypothetical protein